MSRAEEIDEEDRDLAVFQAKRIIEELEEEVKVNGDMLLWLLDRVGVHKNGVFLSTQVDRVKSAAAILLHLKLEEQRILLSRSDGT